MIYMWVCVWLCMCMCIYICIYGCVYMYMYMYICICRRSSRMAMLRCPGAKLQTINHVFFSSPLCVYIGVFICIGVYVCVHVYICKIIVDPIWTMKVKSLKCHSLKPRVLVGRFFLPFISKWLGREMGFYVPLSPTWEPGSCVWLAPPIP